VPDFEAMVAVYQVRRSVVDHRRCSAGGKYMLHRLRYIITERHTIQNARGVLESTGFRIAPMIGAHAHRDYDDYSQAYIPHMDKEQRLISLNVGGK
jgi:hypothetical protein